MGLIFWVDEDKFVADLVGKVFQKKGLEFYHLETVADFSFRVLDLKPEVIVMDSETVQKNRDDFEKQFKENIALQDYPYVIKGEEQDFSFILKKVGTLSLPLDVFRVFEILESQLKKSHA